MCVDLGGPYEHDGMFMSPEVGDGCEREASDEPKCSVAW